MCRVSAFLPLSTAFMQVCQDDLPSYTVSVRELCEFAAKEGSLDVRFTPSPSAQEGIAGHKLLAARRGPSYRSEIALGGQFKQLRVRGRADGYDAERNLLEEFKTFKGDLTRLPANHRALHWAQLKVYGWLLCEQSALPELLLGLVYFEIASQQETSFCERVMATELKTFFDLLCERFYAWILTELAHRHNRDRALVTLRFPHADFRRGQRAMAANVFRAARSGRCLLAQAPTGIGKTLGSLFPLLKAAPEQRLDKIFFLSAKGTGHELALQAIRRIRETEPALTLRCLVLVAREKACEHPDKACHGDSCPLAHGFYDRLPAARAAAVSIGELNQASLRAVALDHALCPYYLSQELVRWSDVVIADYNYYFDYSALLHALTLTNAWRVALLVDEAHNLIDRARDMYSASLSQSDLGQIRKSAPLVLKRPLERLNRAWNALTRTQTQAYETQPRLPQALMLAIAAATDAIGDLLSEPGEKPDPTLLRFHFDALYFIRMAEHFGDHSIFDVQLHPDPINSGRRRILTTLCIRNVLPAPFLKSRFEAAHSSVLFSATLTPAHFYTETLGLPGDVTCIDIESPFDASQLKVQIVSDISTRYGRRDQSLAPISELMAREYDRRPGNYLAFFSSFDYLQQVLGRFAAAYPQIPVWQQSRGMGEVERHAFLAHFSPDGCGIGFAVLGGVFAEGIDLPGQRLIGAFIATLGLPQFNAVNQEMKRRIDSLLGEGYEYTYLFPGLRKVVQAAGRVIRTPSDRGQIFLIDDRYARPEVRALLPAWWAQG